MAVKAVRQGPINRKEGLLVTELSNPKELFIYDLHYNKAFCLNHAATLVWQYCDGEHSISTIAEYLNTKLNIQAGEYTVRYILKQLDKHHLLEEYITQPIMTGVFRREFIRSPKNSADLVFSTITLVPVSRNVQTQNCNILLQPSESDSSPDGPDPIYAHDLSKDVAQDL